MCWHHDIKASPGCKCKKINHAGKIFNHLSFYLLSFVYCAETGKDSCPIRLILYLSVYGQILIE